MDYSYSILNNCLDFCIKQKKVIYDIEEFYEDPCLNEFDQTLIYDTLWDNDLLFTVSNVNEDRTEVEIDIKVDFINTY
jgi:hypothetical protein